MKPKTIMDRHQEVAEAGAALRFAAVRYAAIPRDQWGAPALDRDLSNAAVLYAGKVRLLGKARQ